MALAASSSRCMVGSISTRITSRMLPRVYPRPSVNLVLHRALPSLKDPSGSIKRPTAALAAARPPGEGEAAADAQDANLPDADAAAVELAPQALHMKLSEAVGMLSIPDGDSSSSSSSDSSSDSDSDSDSEEEEGECDCGKESVLDKAARVLLKEERHKQKEAARAEEKQHKQALKAEKKKQKEEEKAEKRRLKAEEQGQLQEGEVGAAGIAAAGMEAGDSSDSGSDSKSSSDSDSE